MTRSDFLKLVKLDAEALKSLARRNQLPFMTDDNPDRKLGDYTFMEAFLTVLAADISGPEINSGRTASSDIIASVAGQLYRHWPEIGTTAKALCDGQNVADEILCGRIFLAGFYEPLPFCEPVSKLGNLMLANGPVVRIVATNASRGMAVIMRRAARHGIKVPDDMFIIRSPDPAAQPVQVIDPAAIYARMNAPKPGAA